MSAVQLEVVLKVVPEQLVGLVAEQVIPPMVEQEPVAEPLVAEVLPLQVEAALAVLVQAGVPVSEQPVLVPVESVA